MNHTILSHLALAGAISVLAIGCEKNDKPSSTETSSAAERAPNANTTTTAMKTAEPAPTTSTGPSAKPSVTWKGVGLMTPESVLHDATADVYLVSNIEGQPSDADGKGFISKLAPDGTVATLKWIESGKNKVTLNAPKGMTLMGDNLYVADIDTVRIFDKKTGNPAGEVKVPGASFLNDMATTADGKVIVSDSGIKWGAKGAEPTGSDAVYAIDKDKKLTTIAKAKELGAPNGLAVGADGKIWVCTNGSGEVYSLDAKGKRGDIQKLPKGSLDGIMFLGSDLVVSSWDASAIYRGKPGSDLKMVIEGVKAPADFGYDAKRGKILVPLFMENEIRGFDLK